MGGSDAPGIQCDFVILRKERERVKDTCLEKNQTAVAALPFPQLPFLLKAVRNILPS